METSCASHWAGLHLFGLISPLVFLLPVMLQVLTFDPSLVRTAVMDIIIVRPRSEEQRRLQLCAKPPRRPIAAQRALASSLPASWRESGALSGSGGAVLAGFLRCGWQVGASGRCEKHPIMALEPGKPLRRGP